MRKWVHPKIKGLEFHENGTFTRWGTFRKGTINRLGYWQLGIDGKSFLAHRLIFECVMGRELTHKEVVNHKNRNRSDNSFENLELTTQGGNIAHYHREHSEIKEVKVEVIRPLKSGEKHHNAKLTLKQVEDMILDMFAGANNTQLGEKYGVHPRYVSLIRHKKRWKTAWKSLGLEGSTTIPSGSRASSDGVLETEPSLQLRDMI